MKIGDLVLVSPHTSVNAVEVTEEQPGVVVSNAKNFQGCLGFYDVLLRNDVRIFSGSARLTLIEKKQKKSLTFSSLAAIL